MEGADREAAAVPVLGRVRALEGPGAGGEGGGADPAAGDGDGGGFGRGGGGVRERVVGRFGDGERSPRDRDREDVAGGWEGFRHGFELGCGGGGEI